MKNILIILLLFLASCVAPKKCCAQYDVAEYIKNYEGKAKQRLEAEKKERQGKAGVPPITTTIGLQLRISNFLARTFGND